MVQAIANTELTLVDRRQKDYHLAGLIQLDPITSRGRSQVSDQGKRGFLALEDGTVYEGVSIGADGEKDGEVVFNTSLTGYQ